MQDSNIPTKIGTVWAASAIAPYINTVPVPSQQGITNGRASFTDGFPPNCFIPLGSGGAGPFGGDTNGILNLITKWLQWTQAGGPLVYDAAFSTSIGGYPSGAVVGSATVQGLSWFSTADNNTTDPDTGGANWTPIFGAGFLIHAGNPNGAVAGSAASPQTYCWDSTHGLLWACTTTGNAASAVWTQVGAQTIIAPVLIAAGSGNYTVPAGIYVLRHIRLWGPGGGGGASGPSSQGAGGGGGGYCEMFNFAVTPGQVLAYVVGSGGAGGTSSSDGSPGSADSTFIGMTAGHGLGGAGNGGSGGASAGTATGGNGLNLHGQPGLGGFSLTTPGLGGPGGAAFGGAGGGMSFNSAGTAGLGPGSGGSGGSASGATPHAGGAGQDGLLIIEV